MKEKELKVIVLYNDSTDEMIKGLSEDYNSKVLIAKTPFEFLAFESVSKALEFRELYLGDNEEWQPNLYKIKYGFTLEEPPNDFTLEKKEE